MTDFFQALVNPAIPFLRYALLAGILSSASFGVIGTYVVVKRITYIAGAISHSVLGGIGFALFCRYHYNWTWFHPLLGAFFAAVVSALIIGSARLYAKEREDTVIGAIWAIGMATGLLFIARTPGYVEPMSYLFGNILIVSRPDLFFILVLDVIVVLAGIFFYHQLQASSFDEDFTAIRGIDPRFYYYLLLILTAITVVLMTTIVGIVMVIALITLPAAISSMFFKRIWQIMIGTTILTMVFTIAGVSVSYIYDFPSGPTIILLAGIVYLCAFIFKPLIAKGRKSRTLSDTG